MASDARREMLVMWRSALKRAFLSALLLISCRAEEAKAPITEKQTAVTHPMWETSETAGSSAAPDSSVAPTNATDVSAEVHFAVATEESMTDFDMAPRAMLASDDPSRTIGLYPVDWANQPHAIVRRLNVESVKLGFDTYRSAAYWLLEVFPGEPTNDFPNRGFVVVRGDVLDGRRYPHTITAISSVAAGQPNGAFIVPVKRDSLNTAVWIYDELGASGTPSHILNPAKGQAKLLWCGVIGADGGLMAAEVCP